jgi:hypothetical protein
MYNRTRAAQKLIGFSHEETKIKKYPNSTTEEGPVIEVFLPGVIVETVGSYTAKHGGVEYALRKFTMPEGEVYFEDVQGDVLWGSLDPKSPCHCTVSTIYMALKNEKGKWIESTLWSKISGVGYFGWDMIDRTEV